MTYVATYENGEKTGFQVCAGRMQKELIAKINEAHENNSEVLIIIKNGDKKIPYVSF